MKRLTIIYSGGKKKYVVIKNKTKIHAESRELVLKVGLNTTNNERKYGRVRKNFIFPKIKKTGVLRY